MPVCPICNNELQDGESFSLEYYAPKNWWVFYHNRDITEREYVTNTTDEDGYGRTIKSFRGRCARANVVIWHPIPWTIARNKGFQLRGTDWISF